MEVGMRVATEYGKGTVALVTRRSVTLQMDEIGVTLNIVVGSHGYDRIKVLPLCPICKKEIARTEQVLDGPTTYFPCGCFISHDVVLT